MTVEPGFWGELSEHAAYHGAALVATGVCLLVLGLLRSLVAAARRPPMRFPVACLGLYLLSLPVHAFMRANHLTGQHDWIDLPSTILLSLGIIQVAALVLFDVAGRSLARIRILRTVASATAGLIVTLALVHQQGVNLSAIFATSAVLTGVIGFALQETLGNVIGGIALQLESSMAPGDWVSIGEVSGQVYEMRWRSISVVTRNDDMVVIPNGVLSKTSFINLSRPVPWHRQWVQFDVHYRHPPNEVQRVVLEALKGVPNVREDPPPDCILFRMEQDHAHYAVRYRLIDLRSDDGTDSEVKKRIWYSLRRSGIEIPYPSRNVFITELSKERADSKVSTEHARRIDSLKRVAIFAPLDEAHFEHLAQRCRVQVYGAGEIVLRQGAPGDSMYLLREGTVSIRVGVEGIEREVATLSAGELFGEMSLLTGEARTATVIARGDCECYVVDRALFQEVIGGSEVLVKRIAMILAERHAELEGEVAQIGAEAASRRMANHADLYARVKRFFGIHSDGKTG